MKILTINYKDKGYEILLDDEDFNKQSQYSWYLSKVDNCYYALRNENKRTILLHREILGLKSRKDGMVDHINHNGLDNRKENLRLCTPSQNMMNKRIGKNNTSGFKGVCLSKIKRNNMIDYYWKARVQKEGKVVFNKYFKRKGDAVEAYNKAAKQYFGEFALLN